MVRDYMLGKKYRQCRELMQRLAQTDATWDLGSIERRIEQMYFKVQEAWMRRDQSIAREFMSDRLYEKHKMQTDLMRSEHRRNVLESINLTEAKVVNVSDYMDDSSDCFWVYIRGSMIDYIVNDQTGERISGDASKSEGFAEMWKVVRGKTGWVLDEIKQSATVFDLFGLHPYSEGRALLPRPPTAIS